MDCGNKFPLWLHGECSQARRVDGRCSQSGVLPPQSTPPLSSDRHFRSHPRESLRRGPAYTERWSSNHGWTRIHTGTRDGGAGMGTGHQTHPWVAVLRRQESRSPSVSIRVHPWFNLILLHVSGLPQLTPRSVRGGGTGDDPRVPGGFELLQAAVVQAVNLGRAFGRFFVQ